jgi:hypothetical protein
MEDIKITYDPFFNEVVYSVIIRGAGIVSLIMLIIAVNIARFLVQVSTARPKYR